jgi:hypothetical protein
MSFFEVAMDPVFTGGRHVLWESLEGFAEKAPSDISHAFNSLVEKLEPGGQGLCRQNAKSLRAGSSLP